MSDAQNKAQTALTTADKRGAEARSQVLVMLEKCKGQIRLALPKHLTPERMIRIAYSAVQRSPKLLECDPMSIAKSVIEASELGLEPSGVLGLAYLVPRWNNKTRRTECSLQVGYRGFIELAGRSGRLRSIFAEVVYDCDTFDFERGLTPKLVHRPLLAKPEGAKPIAAYAVATFTDGGSVAEVLSLADIEKRRASSSAEQARKDGKLRSETPWETHWEEMAKKSAVRALAKYLPLSPELTRAAVADEYREAGVDAIDVDFSTADALPEGDGEPGQEG